MNRSGFPRRRSGEFDAPPSPPAFSRSPSTMERRIVRFRASRGSPRPSSIMQAIEEPLWIPLNSDPAGFCTPRLRRLPRWSYLGAPLRALAANGIALRHATSATIRMHFATERLLYDGLRIRRIVSRTMIDWRSLRLMVSLLYASVMRLPPRDGFMMDCRV